jgi:hydrogenase nickel incorporation protein HypA/HybF
MHELDLARNIVELAVEAAERMEAVRVNAVNLRVGRLAGVDPGALHFAFDVATADTLLAGARLQVIDVPLVVWCAHCLTEVELPQVNHFRCPRCGTAAGEIRQGRELEIASLEIDS